MPNRSVLLALCTTLAVGALPGAALAVERAPSAQRGVATHPDPVAQRPDLAAHPDLVARLAGRRPDTSAVLAALRAQTRDRLGRAGFQTAAGNRTSRPTTGAAQLQRGPTASPADLAPDTLVLAAGDLSGRGAADLLELRYAAGSSANGRRVLLIARDGATGAVRWTTAVHEAAGHALYPAAATVGAGPGVLLVDTGAVQGGEHTAVLTQTLIGLDGRTGRRVFWHGARGRLDSDARGFTLVGDAELAGPAGPDLLLSVTDARYDLGDDGQVHHASGAAKPYVLSHRTGRAAPAGPQVALPAAVPTITAVPDLSGDGVDDYVVLRPGDPVSVQARRTDGTAIWELSGLVLQDDAFVQPVGLVTGSRAGGRVVGDLAVGTGGPGYPGPVARVALLQGSDGRRRWTADGSVVAAVGRAGPDLRSAVQVVGFDQRINADGSRQDLVRVQALDAAGGAVYDTVLAGPLQPASEDDGSFAYASVLPAGDLQADGAQELLAAIGSASGERDLVVDGRTGSSRAAAGAPLGAGVTGPAADLVRVWTGAHGMHVQVRSGRDGTVMWTRLLPATGDIDLAFASAAPLTGRRCADVVVQAQSGSRTLVQVLAPDGATRWKVTALTGAPGPGSVVLPALAPRPAC